MVNNTQPINLSGGHDAIIVIVAAGKGLRFGGDAPKQFVDLEGRPVLIHTIEAFRSALPQSRIILVLSTGGKDIWQEICHDYEFASPEIVIGGSCRSDSVANALKLLDNKGDKVVMIHDGARPLVSTGLIQRMYQAIAVDHFDAAVPATLPTDAICMLDNSALRPVDRNQYRNVQTPQSFRLSVIKEAYTRRNSNVVAADDATMVRINTEYKIHEVEGEKTNIKITNPFDIEIASVFLRKR